MPIYDIPEAVELQRVEPVYLAPLIANNFFFDHFPFEGKRESLLRWVQRDNYTGLQQVRGYGGKPGRVKMVNDNEYIQKPGVYGEYAVIEEEELTRRRDAATLSGGPIPIADLVAECHEFLLVRRINRIRKILADLITTGTFSTSDFDGTVIHTDSYTQQTFTSATPWSTAATSTPIADIRSMQLIPVGQSVDMGPAARLGMNRVQFNRMIANTNQNDLGGRRLLGLTPANSLMAINQILAGENLPTIEIVEDGYYPYPGGAWTRYMPTGTVVIIGKRQSGVPVGRYRFTLNAQSPNAAPEPYVRVIDKSAFEVPGGLEVHDGHNGGVVLQFPGAIVKGSC